LTAPHRHRFPNFIALGLSRFRSASNSSRWGFLVRHLLIGAAAGIS
jgi:hypothetical protein